MHGWALAFLTGILTGVITDSHHQPVASAKVHLREPGGKEVAATTSDSSGTYRFTTASGTYTVRAEDTAFNEAASAPVSVSEGKTTSLDLVLGPSYFDKPQFTVAGVTDNTYRGGHGSDTVLRSAESLTKATAALSKPSPDDSLHPLDTVRKLQSAAETAPTEQNLFDWATELLAHRTPQPAAEVYEQGAHLFPRSTRMLLGLASARYAAGNYEGAADSFFKAADLNPNDELPYRFLSEVQRREITQLPGYADRLARFAALQPENPLANYWYALVLPGGPKKRALLDKAVSLDPNFAPAHLQLGILDGAESNYSEAVREYSNAIRIQPDLEEAHYRLAEAYRLTGATDKAQQERAIYNQLSKQATEKVEQERREVQQFVITLKAQ